MGMQLDDTSYKCQQNRALSVISCHWSIGYERGDLLYLLTKRLYSAVAGCAALRRTAALGHPKQVVVDNGAG
jgi:hypothetical protein